MQPVIISLVVALVAFGLSSLSGFVIVPFLRKLKAGAHILEIGPSWHKSKEGTPLMGGFMFVLGSIAATILGVLVYVGVDDGTVSGKGIVRLAVGIITALLFMCVGFVDDYIKVVKKRNKGLSARQKMAMQIIISAAFLLALYLLGNKTTEIWFPFIGNIDFWIFYYPLMILFIIFMVNSVNLTDGVDGLCGSVTLIFALCFTTICTIVGIKEYSIFAIALAGACMGYLLWNLHPAKVMMGDTGSMFLGGCVVALGFACRLEFLIVVAGIIYVLESLSVILQVISFKTTGKRIFKMSPIHHHFELCKWGEYKIVGVFSLVTLVFSGLAIWAAVEFVNQLAK